MRLFEHVVLVMLSRYLAAKTVKATADLDYFGNMQK